MNSLMHLLLYYFCSILLIYTYLLSSITFINDKWQMLQMYLQLHPNQYLYLYMHIINKVQLIVHQFELFYCMIWLC